MFGHASVPKKENHQNSYKIGRKGDGTEPQGKWMDERIWNGLTKTGSLRSDTSTDQEEKVRNLVQCGETCGGGFFKKI